MPTAAGPRRGSDAQAAATKDNADRNASIVIGKRAVNQIMDTGTVLSKRGVLSTPEPADIGRGADGKTGGETDVVPSAHGDEASKEKHRASFLPEAA